MNYQLISWAEKYRPQKIDDLIFPNTKWKKIINEWIQNEFIGGNIIMAGSGGIGKSTLVKILCNNIIKNSSDLKIIKSRSVQEIDQINEFIRNRPISSKTKIIVIEEADRLSSQSQNELKDKYAEKYQEHCSIIMTTNYPHKIDDYLLQRFLYKIDFTHLDHNEIFNRLNFIIESENSKINEDELKSWIEQNAFRGMRDMINTIQLSSKINNGIIVLEDLTEIKSLESKIIILCKNIISSYMNCKDIKKRKMAFINPVASEIIGPQWVEFVTILNNNYGFDYSIILEELEKDIHFIPIKNIFARYLEELEIKKYPHLHLISCLSEIMKAIIEVTY